MSKLLGGLKQPQYLQTRWRQVRRRLDYRRIPEITSHRIALRRLPASMNGLRVVQLSDIHYGLYIPRRNVERAVEMANRLKPDLVALTGDFVTHSADYVAPVAEILGGLRAPLGVFAVLGNHDYRPGADYVAARLRSHGIRVLRNSHARVERDGRALWLAGVDDLWFDCDLPRALRGVPAAAPRLLLCHNPAIILQAALHGVDLVLSGHTHGGQVNLPGLAPLLARTRFLSGWDRLHQTHIYVNRGLGKSIVPFRIGCPPEIAVFQLHAEGAPASAVH